VIPAAELFNVTDGNAVLQRSTSVGTYNPKATVPFCQQCSTFNQIEEVQSPRIVRLGLQLNF
jgi:hypothetical protein